MKYVKYVIFFQLILLFQYTNGGDRKGKSVQKTSVSQAPKKPQNIKNPSVSQTPKVPQNTKNPSVSQAPKKPQNIKNPSVSQTPKVPQNTKNPSVSQAPKVPQNRKNSSVSQAPKVPQNIKSSSVSQAPKVPQNIKKQDIDEGLYSRQLYVLGHDAMRRMAKSDVLISGLGGVGVEIAKNLILGGVKSVTLHDEKKATWADLSTQFYLTEKDIGKNRAVVSLPKLSKLNNYVSCSVSTEPLNEEFIKKFAVVVLTEKSQDEQLRISEITHNNNIALVITDAVGLSGQIFCDFGENFVVTDTNGEPPKIITISSITKDNEGLIIYSEKQHLLKNEEYVTFSEVRGMTELNGCKAKKIKRLGPKSFRIADTSNYSKYIDGGIAVQVKMPKTIKFKRLSESLKSPDILTYGFSKVDYNAQLHLAFATLHEFVKVNNKLPASWNSNDADKFLKLADSVNKLQKNKIIIDEKFFGQFSKISRGMISPVTGAIGGIAAQEVMKACSGKFYPIYQWFYLNSMQALSKEDIPEEEAKVQNSRYESQIAVFGKSFQEKLGNLNIFIVGAGAIGCELLKNFAMMGIGARKGKIFITDMDTIEKSNLNRQFLFRPQDVKRPKSTTAANAIREMNPQINVISYEKPVGPDTENIFNDAFYERLDVIANALDNVPARIYMDKRCIYYKKPLLESGTMGTKGSTQVVVPNLTESYGSIPATEEKGIPVCTLKNFPNAIEHTIQWARDMFEGLFHDMGKNAASYIRNPNFIKQTLQLSESQPAEVLATVKAAIVDNRPRTFQDCVTWARLHWEEMYKNQIEQLLYNFPPNHVTETGESFWSRPRRCPKPLKFNINDPLHFNYVFAAANLKAELYGLPQNRDRVAVAKMAANVHVPKFKPKTDITIAENESQLQQLSAGNEGIDNDSVDQLLKKLPSRMSLKGLQIKPIKFEKDDDNNLHMDFIVAASNLRATNYGIENADRHKTKLIAGKIIPAIATTTSIVAGFVGVELYKLVNRFKSVNDYSDSFINLATSTFGFVNPKRAATRTYNDTKWTLWDRFEITGEITLRKFLEYFQTKHSLKISMITLGDVIVYDVFSDESKERMHKNMSEIVRIVTEKELGPHVKALVFELSCDDRKGEDVRVPYVKYKLPVRK